MTNSVQAKLNATDKPLPVLVSTSLKAFNDRFEQGTHPADASAKLTADSFQSIVAHIGDILEQDETPNPEYLDSLLALLDGFGSQLFQNRDLTQVGQPKIIIWYNTNWFFSAVR